MINFVYFLLLIQTPLSLFFLLPSSSSAFFLLGPAVIRVVSSPAQEWRCLKWSTLVLKVQCISRENF